MRELWAARDGDGELWMFDHEPKWMEGPSRFDAVQFGPGKMPPILFDQGELPDLPTGEKCRVELQRAEEAKRLRNENNFLRFRHADSNLPCAYCGLSKADMAKCKSGFPGCARADDLMIEGTT